jgi:hypothetical protein
MTCAYRNDAITTTKIFSSSPSITPLIAVSESPVYQEIEFFHHFGGLKSQLLRRASPTGYVSEPRLNKQSK